MFFVRWLITALAVAAAVWLVPGINLFSGQETWIAVAIFGLILALLDISIKPILQVLLIPVTIITLGLFYIVVNTLLLYMASWLSDSLFHVGFYISSFGSAFLASIVISIVSTILNAVVGNDN